MDETGSTKTPARVCNDIIDQIRRDEFGIGEVDFNCRVLFYIKFVNLLSLTYYYLIIYT